MIVNVNEDENRKSIVEHLDKNMSVEAGAGAGKTTIIIQRIMEQLKAGTVTADKLVVITFTNAAAEELRERLLKKLREEMELVKDEKEKANLRSALDNQNKIQISTIHSFCFRLLKEQSFAAKLPLDARILENSEEELEKKSFFSDWYATLSHTELKAAEDEFYKGEFQEYLFNTYMSLSSIPDGVNIIYDKTKLDPKAKKLDDYIDDIITQIKVAFAKIVDEVNNLSGESFKDYQDIIDHPRNFPSGKPAEFIMASWVKMYKLLDPKNSENPLINKSINIPVSANHYKEIVDTYSKLWDEYEIKKMFKAASPWEITKIDAETLSNNVFNHLKNNGLYNNIEHEVRNYQNALVVDMAVNARDEYRKYLKQSDNRSGLTNDQILQEALELVRDNKEAASYFRSKFSCIYVDEFQDTDLVQRELVLELCKDDSNPSGLRSGSLFFVGDPKQSIYAFRGADVDVYYDTRGKYTDSAIKDTEIYTLTANYRSEDDIIEWVNKNYANNTSGTGRFQSMLPDGYEDMTAVKFNPPADDVIKGVYSLDLPIWLNADAASNNTQAADAPAELSSTDVYPNIKTARAKDADMGVEIIKQLVNNRMNIYVKDDKAESGYRKKPIEYRDFLVLCGVQKHINQYADKLKKAGIPINLYGALDVADEDVAIRFRALYHYLTWPFDRKAKHGAMEVLLGERVTLDNKDEGARRAELLFARTKRMEPMQLLRYLADHVEYILPAEVNGEMMLRSQSRLQQIYEYVVGLDYGNRKDIDGYLDDYMVSDVDKELALERDQDAVRLMNLHKAKGLEGNIVIVASRSTRRNHKNSYRKMDVLYPVAKSEFLNSEIEGYMGMKDPNNLYIADLAKKQEKDEYTRQDYVETTRAKEALIFMDALSGGCIFNDYSMDGVTNLLNVASLAGLKAAIDNIYKDKPNASFSAKVPNAAYDTHEWDITIDEDKKKHIFRHISPSGLEVDDRSKWKPGEEASDRPVGNIFGNVMHRSFELLVNIIRDTGDVSGIDISKPINQAIMENYMDIIYDSADEGADGESTTIERYSTYLTDKLSAFISDEELVNKIKSATEVFTEMHFSEFVDADELRFDAKLQDALERRNIDILSDKCWLNGQADLVIYNADGTVEIIDYKSDKMGSASINELEEHLHNAYDSQQLLYKYVVSRALGVDMDKVSFRYYHMYK